EKARLVSHGDQREETAITQSPNPDALRIDIGKRLEIIRTHPGVLGVVAANVHVHSVAPVAAITDTAAIIRRQHYVPLLEQILMEAVIHGIVPLHVPSIVVLVDSVAVNPNDCRILFAAVEIPGYEQPRGHRLTI